MGCYNGIDARIITKEELDQQKSYLYDRNQAFCSKYLLLPQRLLIYQQRDLSDILGKQMLHKIVLTSINKREIEKAKDPQQKLFETMVNIQGRKVCNIFQETINSYHEFLAHLFDIKSKIEQDNSEEPELNSSADASFYTMHSTVHSIYDTPKVYNRIIYFQLRPTQNKLKSSSIEKAIAFKHVKFYKKLIKLSEVLSSEENCAFLVEQCNFIFGVLRHLIEIQFKDFLQLIFNDDPNNFPEQELLVQSVLQHYLFARNKTAHLIIQQVIEKYYYFADKKTRNLKLEKQAEQDLRISLIPKQEYHQSRLVYSQNSWEEEYKDEVRNLQTISEDFEQDTNETKFFLSVSYDHSQENCHYQELFPLIKNLIITSKFWRKYKSIMKIDQQIEVIYMRQRTSSQEHQLYDQISAVDSKLEILIYVLKKFSQCYPTIEMKNDLYNPLRFMMDFDNILHYDIKYVHQPHFLTFFEITTRFIYSI